MSCIAIRLMDDFGSLAILKANSVEVALLSSNVYPLTKLKKGMGRCQASIINLARR